MTMNYLPRSAARGSFFCRQHATSTSRSRRPVLADATSSSRRHQQRGSDGGSAVPPYVIYGFVAPVAGVAAATAYAYYRCLDDAPFTSRRRFLATTPQWEERMGHEKHQQMLAQFRGDALADDHRATATVRRVGGKHVPPTMGGSSKQHV